MTKVNTYEKTGLSQEDISKYYKAKSIIVGMSKDNIINEEEAKLLDDYVVYQLYILKLEKDLENPNLKPKKRMELEKEINEYKQKELDTRMEIGKYLDEFQDRYSKKQQQENTNKKGR